MLLILVQKESNRLYYTMQLMLGRLLGLEYRFTANLADFLQYDGPKFSYGMPVDEKLLFFYSQGLLFEKSITYKQLRYFDYDGSKAFFTAPPDRSPMPFDVFSAAFFLVSRYEEYIPHLRDDHNRYKAINSEAFRNGFLQIPLVNRWANKLGEVLKERFTNLPVKMPEYKFRLTIDIDAAYAYRNKGITRTIGGMIKAWQEKNYDDLMQRIRVLTGREADPFDTFGMQLELLRKYDLEVLYFILLADYGAYDKNIPPNNRHFQQLIRVLADYAEIGIHPSYASSTDPALLEIEIGRLSRILKREITNARQHFLKLSLPDTYRTFIHHDITDDFTMGYADAPGFRASICTPFPFYDLDQDLPTTLILHPFAVMDGTLNNYMNLNPAQSIEIIRKLISETRNARGTFIPLWHNQSLNEQGEWKGWLKVFTTMLELGIKS